MPKFFNAKDLDFIKTISEEVVDYVVEQLRENLNEVSKKQRMENEAAMVDQQQQIIQKIPLNIYVG